MKQQVLAGLSLMPDDDFADSTYPLFEDGLVDWVEWTFDMGWSDRGVPGWLRELLDYFGERGRLSGHGVQYSALSARWTDFHDRWVARLDQEVRERKYAHISEHFGLARAGQYLFHAPLPVPYCDAAISVGRDNIAKIAAIARCPIGLENLALAFCPLDVAHQGEFLDKLLAPVVDGFLVLDLHNLYCQSVNFQVPFFELLKSYPLERVTEIHISGGSFSHSSAGNTTQPIRRDTHDGPVPQELFDFLPRVIESCPRVQVVILERLGNTLSNKSERSGFASEFRKLRKTLYRLQTKSTNIGSQSGFSHTTLQTLSRDRDLNHEEKTLLVYQDNLLNKLSEDRDATWVKMQLVDLHNNHSWLLGYIDELEVRMLEVGQELTKKWGVRV
ncbi:MAG: DUF692 domain-containing protein [Candidatus Obscuribacterales bacterium]|nr:DUF692 domain-containing protein [Candidatus Obscuribacterales bacterium]